MILRRRWLRLITGSLGLTLAMVAVAPAAPPASNVQMVVYNRRSFLVPFNIPPADIPRYKEIQLWSATSGGDYQRVASTTPDRPFFNFTAQTDGEFWFAVRTVDNQGRLFPSDNATIRPNMKVTIDTTKPVLEITPRARRGNVASIEWTATDESLDLDTLAFDYQVENSTEWIPIPLSRPARSGVESWDAGTSEPLKVRGVVNDKAKNRQAVEVALSSGSAAEEMSPAPNEPVDANTPPPIGTFASRDTSRTLSASRNSPRNRGGNPENAGDYDPYSASASGTADRLAANDPSPTPAPGTAEPPILVASPKFGLQYQVDDAGPNGPAIVELYVTSDGGRTWTNRGGDPDKASPFAVDLGGEGRFGLKLVAKSAAEQGDRPPVDGELPRTVVDVDSTGPVVTLDRPRLEGNRLAIHWQATDAHPASRPVMISVRADSPDSRWQIITPTPVENTGQYNWLISARCPAKVHVRIDVHDELGNLSFAETSAQEPVIVDRSKPKSRILGLEKLPAASGN